VTFSVGGVSITRATDNTHGSTGDATKRFVDASITIGPDATNNIGQPHTFTVTVLQDDGLTAAQGGDGVTGPTPATSGHVDVTLTNGGAAIAVVDTGASTCDDPGNNLNASGQCTITFTSGTPGTVTGHATVTLTISGVSVTRQTDGVAPNSGDAVKIFLAGSIRWTKVDNTGVTLQGGATFQLCQTTVFIPPNTFMPLVGGPVCKDVVDNGSASATAYADGDPADGKFMVTGLALGDYTIQETVAPPGFVKDPDTVPVQLNPQNPNVEVTQAFVNTRPILKITGFGYTNSPIGTPTHGVTKGTVVYTVNLHNYGNADAVLTDSSLVVTAPASANLVCGATTPSLTGTIAPDADGGPYTKTCTYDAQDGDQITATLTVKTDTGGFIRDASGSPATIVYTVQSD